MAKAIATATIRRETESYRVRRHLATSGDVVHVSISFGGLLHFTLRPWKFDIGNSDYNISTQSGYVLIERPLGYEVVLSEQAAMLKEVSTFCKEAGCTKVLVLGPKTKMSLTVADIYGFGIEAAKLRLQVAVVESHDASKEDVSFLETVMRNRGGWIQFFDTKEKAKEWLAFSK